MIAKIIEIQDEIQYWKEQTKLYMFLANFEDTKFLKNWYTKMKMKALKKIEKLEENNEL